MLFLIKLRGYKQLQIKNIIQSKSNQLDKNEWTHNHFNFMGHKKTPGCNATAPILRI